MRTSELTGATLDYWVARSEGWEAEVRSYRQDPFGKGVEIVHYCNLKKGNRPFSPSAIWTQGGPIIERERIKIMPTIPTGQTWYATMSRGDTLAEMEVWRGKADTPLVAAMRAYVASKFGDEVQEGSESNG